MGERPLAFRPEANVQTQAALQLRKRPRQARSRAMVDDLVEATARVLVAEGYVATSTNRIAEVAGVSVGSLYQYFPGKDALVMAVARRHFDQMTALLHHTASGAVGRPADQVVRDFVRGMIAAHAVEPALHRAITEQVLHLGLDVVDEVQATARRIVRAWLEAQRDRILPRDLDHAAFLLVTVSEAAVHAALLTCPERLQDPAFEAELADMLVRYLGAEAR